ncbi:energy transducer TonB family protein [Pseudooceanicola nitratireducens]|uniref:energy transducer TonB family protein n=1 Tax=Pseudooceanicola nitratireducens TaxID=517719 RepID=UPI003C79BD34
MSRSIPMSRLATVSAIALAVAAHAVVVRGLYSEPEILLEGSAGAAEARIGSYFEDVSQGTLTPEDAEDLAEETPPEPLEPTPPEEIPQDQPAPVETAEVAEPAPLTPPVETPVETPVDTQPLTAQIPQTPDGMIPLAPQPELIEAQPEPLPEVLPDVTELAEAPPPEPLPAETPEVTEVLEAEAEPTLAESSKRPMLRDPRLETPVRPDPKPAPKPKPKVAQKQGNKQQKIEATAGASDGKATAQATTKGQGGGKTREAGNARASNYPGQVYRKLSRVRKPKVRGRGSVTVRFSVTGSGGLGGLSVARSSGSAEIDQAALSMVRRAAPFPNPPSGAQRDFRIPIDFTR